MTEASIFTPSLIEYIIGLFLNKHHQGVYWIISPSSSQTWCLSSSLSLKVIKSLFLYMNNPIRLGCAMDVIHCVMRTLWYGRRVSFCRCTSQRNCQVFRIFKVIVCATAKVLFNRTNLTGRCLIKGALSPPSYFLSNWALLFIYLFIFLFFPLKSVYFLFLGTFYSI